jgi:hypothetical protein
MTQMTPEELKLIERIKKLQAMAEGAREVGSLAEAESFMEAVTKTLAKHNLDESVLSIDLKDHTDPLVRGWALGSTRRHRNKPVRWAQWLSFNVAHAHFCENMVSLTSSHVFFYGRKSNVDVAVKMYTYLRDMAERLGWKAYRQYCAEGGPLPAKWYLDWLEGFALEVGRRYEMMRVRVESDSGMALVLTSVREEATKLVKDDQAPKEELDEAPEAWKGADFYDARRAGREAARTANLTPNALDGAEAAPERRTLR